MEREVTIRSESVVSTQPTTEPHDGGAGTCLSSMFVRAPARSGSRSLDSRVARARPHIHSPRPPCGRIVISRRLRAGARGNHPTFFLIYMLV